MKTIAIKIKNPTRVARSYGDCADDFTPAECQWWVGTPKQLYVAAVKPPGAIEIRAGLAPAGDGVRVVGLAHTPKQFLKAARKAVIRSRREANWIRPNPVTEHKKWIRFAGATGFIISEARGEKREWDKVYAGFRPCDFFVTRRRLQAIAAQPGPILP